MSELSRWQLRLQICFNRDRLGHGQRHASTAYFMTTSCHCVTSSAPLPSFFETSSPWQLLLEVHSPQTIASECSGMLWQTALHPFKATVSWILKVATSQFPRIRHDGCTRRPCPTTMSDKSASLMLYHPLQSSSVIMVIIWDTVIACSCNQNNLRAPLISGVL